MKISQTEIRLLEQLAKGNRNLKEIAVALEKSGKQIYRTINKLKEKNLITRLDSTIEVVKSTPVSLFLQLLSGHPNLIALLSDSGISVFTSLLNPKSMPELVEETGLKKGIIYRKIKAAKSISLVIKKNKKFALNEKIWPEAIEFLMELKRFEDSTDARVPAGAVIYFKNENEIVFSSKERLNAALTGFSAFNSLGLKIFTHINYYYLPQKKLSKREIFRHSLYITEKEKSIRNLIYLALYFLKFRKELLRIKHQTVNEIKAVIAGKSIHGFPSLAEIKEKAEMYDIKI